MALPNPSMSFSPFAILTAEEMNDLVENIEALQDWSAFETDSMPGTLIPDGTVPVLRDIRYYTSNATWTKTAGMVGNGVVRVKGQAGGGGGGGSGTTNEQVGNGGGGGGYSEKKISAGDLGATETVTVGGGG